MHLPAKRTFRVHALVYKLYLAIFGSRNLRLEPPKSQARWPGFPTPATAVDRRIPVLCQPQPTGRARR